MPTPFQNKFTFEHRKREADKILKKHPDRIPTIVELEPKSTLEPLDKQKFLVPPDLTVGEFLKGVIRKRVKVGDSEALFLFISDKVLAPVSRTMGSIYSEYKNHDNFLYITVNTESTFG